MDQFSCELKLYNPQIK